MSLSLGMLGEFKGVIFAKHFKLSKKSSTISSNKNVVVINPGLDTNIKVSTLAILGISMYFRSMR